MVAVEGWTALELNRAARASDQRAVVTGLCAVLHAVCDYNPARDSGQREMTHTLPGLMVLWGPCQ